MTTPGQVAPDGAFVIGGGDYTFGQDYTNDIVKQLFHVSFPTDLSSAVDILQEYLLKMPIEALRAFKDVIPGSVDDDFADALTAISTIIDNIQDSPVFLLLNDFTSWVVDFITNILGHVGDLLDVKWWAKNILSLGGLIPIGALTDSPVNLLLDPDFDDSASVTALDGWSWDTNQVKVVCDGYNKQMFQRTRVAVEEGFKLNLSGDVKTVSIAGTSWKVALEVVEYNGDAIGDVVEVCSRTTAATSYVTISGDYTVPADVTHVVVAMSVTNATSGTVYFDKLNLHRTNPIKKGFVEGLEDLFGDFTGFVSDVFNNAGAVIGNIAGVVVDAVGNTLQGIWDSIVNGIQGLGGLFSGSTGADIQTVSLNLAANVAAMQSRITALQSAATNGSFSGNSAFVDFSSRADATSLGADFNQTYSGSGTATLGITSGRAAWGGTWGSSGRTGVALYSALQTQTDYQRVGAAFASVPTSGAVNYIYGRVNAAANECVFVELTPSTCKIGCVASGTVYYFATSTLYGGFKAGAVYYLECGTTGGSNIFRVYENDRIILTYTDSGAVSKVGASYRYTAAAATYTASGSSHSTPAQMAAFSMADNTPKPIRGSGFRRYRVSGSTVSQGSGTNLIASNFFDTADLITDDITYAGGSNNKVTVSVSGWYLVNFKVRFDDDLGSTANGELVQALLYVNGTAVQSGVGSWGTGPTSWYGAEDAGGTFVQYLNAGDYVQPGLYIQNTSRGLVGGASGVQSHFEVVFLNNTKPTN